MIFREISFSSGKLALLADGAVVVKVYCLILMLLMKLLEFLMPRMKKLLNTNFYVQVLCLKNNIASILFYSLAIRHYW